MSNFKPLARQSEIVIQEFADEILIYDLRSNKAFNLNQTSALIWHLSNGKRTISEISIDLSQKFDSAITEDFVWLAVEKLQRENLIENNSEGAVFFDKNSRREIVKKIGLTTAVAFPVVLSLIAPTAVHAALSSCPSAACRCPNGSLSCNGSSATVGGITYVNCRTNSGNNPNCNCIGPFNAPDSAGTGFKSSTVGCSFP